MSRPVPSRTFPSPDTGQGGAGFSYGGHDFFCPEPLGNARQPLATTGNLGLSFGVHRAPKDAPAKLLRQVESASQALAVSIAAGNHKLDYIAACVGKSRSYISRLQQGRRAIPDRLVAPLCAATGSNLLAQYRALQDAIDSSTCDQVRRLAALMRVA